MGLETNIEWCDSTVNPTTGCEGCELWGPRIRTCYAGALHETRLAKSLPALYAKDFQEVRLAPGQMTEAARWPDLRGKERPDKPWLNGLSRTIFVGDMSDFCSRGVPDGYVVDEIFGAIRSPEGSRHFWLLLTKQIRRLARLSAQIGGLPDNCMALTTITSQRTAEARIRALLDVECRWHGSRQMCRTDKHGFPKAHRTRKAMFRGFQTGDIVKADIPKGKFATLLTEQSFVERGDEAQHHMAGTSRALALLHHTS